MVKNLPQIQKTSVRSLGWEDPLEKGMATSSSIVAWSNPWTEAWQATVHGVGKWSDVTEHLTHTLTKRNRNTYGTHTQKSTKSGFLSSGWQDKRKKLESLEPGILGKWSHRHKAHLTEQRALTSNAAV